MGEVTQDGLIIHLKCSTTYLPTYSSLSEMVRYWQFSSNERCCAAFHSWSDTSRISVYSAVYIETSPELGGKTCEHNVTSRLILKPSPIPG